jgi:bifunctional UDP-N-acetylglucosamine pyrophosphorylase/glucosamine-1-phosphate N-acetyltransferase
MVPIAGRPLIDWVLARLRAAGIEHSVVVAHRDDHALVEFLRAAHPSTGVALQDERRGIADAVCCALPQLGAVPAYLACACDSLFEPREIATLVARGRRQSGVALVGVLEMDAGATGTRSAVRLDGERVVAIVEKPPPGTAPSRLVAAPLYWLPRALDPLLAGAPRQDGERYVSSALAAHLAAGGVLLAVPLSGRIEVTSAADVERAERLLA